MPLSQPEPIPTPPKVPISSLPPGVDGAFLWGPDGTTHQYSTAFRLKNSPGPGTARIVFPATGEFADVADADLVIPSPLCAHPA